MIDKNLIDEFCTEFPQRYLTVKKYKTLKERERHFHLFGHWNIIHDDGDYLSHSYLNGGNGEIEKLFSKIKFSEMNGVIFCRWEDVFILFKYTSKKGLTPIYLRNKISTFGKITPKHEFYNRNNILVIKEILNFGLGSGAYNYFNAFTGKELEIKP